MPDEGQKDASAMTAAISPREKREEEEVVVKEKGRSGDQIVAVIGECGRWQLEKISIVFFISIPGLSHIFAGAFIAPKTDFWCVKSTTADHHVDNFTKNTCVETCSQYQHDLSFWQGGTMITEFNLICERGDLPVLAKMLFFSGFGLGTFLAGLFSDAFGRKQAMLFFSTLMLLSGMVCTFMPVFSAFLSVWIVVGIAAVANFTVAFVWAMEVLSGKWKVLLGMSMQFTWPLSRMFLLLVAWTLPNWRRILQVVSAPCILAPFLLYFLPESVRWQVAKGRIIQARAIMMEAVRKNKISGILAKDIHLKQPEQTRVGGVTDILRYPVLRSKTLIMYFNWFASSFMLYGLALNWQHLTGGLFMNFLMASILDFPAKLFAVVSLLWWGRKMPYLILNLIAGIFYIAILFIPRGVYKDEMPIVVLSLVCSFCVSSSFSMLWMWMSELMPTTVRNAGVGSASMIARVGGVLATTVGKMADISPSLPIAMFAVASLGSFLTAAFLPETQGMKLADTPEESEAVELLSVKEVLLCKDIRKRAE